MGGVIIFVVKVLIYTVLLYNKHLGSAAQYLI